MTMDTWVPEGQRLELLSTGPWGEAHGRPRFPKSLGTPGCPLFDFSVYPSLHLRGIPVLHSNMRVRLGEHNLRKHDGPEQLRAVSRIIPHPHYEAHSHRHDVMLVRLTRPARLSPQVRPVALPTRCPQPGETCVVSGWGLVSDNAGNTGSPMSQGECKTGAGCLSPGLLGRGYKVMTLSGFTPSPLSSPVYLPDTLHCANISIISASSCNQDYPGHLMSTMVCAGVEGGGTDSCEVRAPRGRAGRREGEQQVWELGWGRVLLALGRRRCWG